MRTTILTFCVSALLGMPRSVPAAEPPVQLGDLTRELSPCSSFPGALAWAPGSSQPPGWTLVSATFARQRPVALYMTDGTDAGTRELTGLPDFVLPEFVTGQVVITAARNAAATTIISVFRSGSGQSFFRLDEALSQLVPLFEQPPLTSTHLPVENRFVLVHVTADQRAQLWSIDGFTDRVVLVDWPAGAGPTPSISLLSSNGRLAWFTVASSQPSAKQLWVTDGTPSGTRQLGPMSPTVSDPSLIAATAIETGLIYTARDTPGSPIRAYFATATTNPSSALATSEGIITPSSVAPLAAGSHALISGSTPNAVQHLFVTDGRSAGTVAISESFLHFTDDRALLSDATAPFGWVVYFGGGTTSSRLEPCRTDGTRAGTRMLIDANPGSGPSNPVRFAAGVDRVYFDTSTDFSTSPTTYFAQSLVSDGEAAGTYAISALAGSPSSLSGLGVIQDRRLFSGGDAAGRELWRFDPSTASFALVEDLCPGMNAASPPVISMLAGETALLSATSELDARQLFLSDGTPQGTRPVLAGAQPLGTSSLHCSPQIGVFGEEFALFAHGAGTQNNEPWLVDRRTATARTLQEIVAGSGGSQSAAGSCLEPAARGQLGPRAVFTAGTWPFVSMWSTDGVPNNAVQIAAFNGVGGGSPFYELATLGDRAYFYAPPPAGEVGSDISIWVTDGTAAGTRRTVDLRRLGVLFQPVPGPIVSWNGRLYFACFLPGGDRRLYSSGGTDETTSLFPLGLDSDPLTVISARPTGVGLLVVLYSRSSFRTSLWRTDGSPGGTSRLTADTPDDRYSALAQVVDAGSRAYFTQWTREHGRELWVTDGTASGTRLAIDLWPGPQSSDPIALRGLTDGRLIFSAYTPDRGLELWQSDGAPGGFGTRLIADLNPGPASSAPTTAAQLGANLIFAADDGSSVGREFWTVALLPPCRCDVDNSGATGIQDLFAFLSLYFSGAGDFNADGATTVQDVFDFLGCWFAGCD